MRARKENVPVLSPGAEVSVRTEIDRCALRNWHV